jgi:Anti-sigma-K factor rskA
MTVDSFPDSSEDVLNDLDPLSRALLDLSVQRGMDDAEIAQVLGTDEASVFEVRVGLLRNLAETVAPERADADLPELEAAVAERLYPELAAEAEPEAEVPVEEEVPVDEEVPVEADDLGDEVDEAELEEPPTEASAEHEPAPPMHARETAPPERRRRSPLVVLLPLLLLITIVALLIALTSGDEEKSEPAAQEPRQQQPDTRPADEPREPRTRPNRLTTLGTGGASGTATLRGDRLTLRLRNLPDPDGGVYTVWLYDSIIDADRLADVRGRTARAKLPKDTKGFEFIDVSLEPRDGNPNHSGQSVLRIPLKKLQ